MLKNSLRSALYEKLPVRRSLAGNLRLFSGAVISILITFFILGFSYFSTSLAHEERLESVHALGSTIARLVARPVSIGDYITVDHALKGVRLQEFVCEMRVVGASGIEIGIIQNSKTKLCKVPHSFASFQFPIVTAKDLESIGERSFGTVFLSVETGDLKFARIRSLAVGFLSGGVLLLLLLILDGMVIDLALYPLAQAVAAASENGAPGEQEFARSQNAIRAAPREIQPLLEKFRELSTAYAKAEGDIRVGKVAHTVAHNIRSPLAALELGCSTRNVPESERVMIRQATRRIRDIANDLITRFKGGEMVSEKHANEPQLLPVLIDEILTEIRLRYRLRGGLEISANIDTANYGLFALVDPSKLRCVLSNLIQNAIEAIPDNGGVTIRSFEEEGMAVITISDTGKGIPAEELLKIGDRGYSYGKPEGSGSGLADATEILAACGGALKITSAAGVGTEVRLSLPTVEPPAWFVPRLEFEGGSHVVVLDDDQSIHQIWDERLTDLKKSGALTIWHCHSAVEIRCWAEAHAQIASRAHYLVDYELMGETETGLTIIEELELQGRATLVTSRYDETDVREACARNHIRLIPKGLAVYVPIRVEQRKIAAVLIDDDVLAHWTWRAVAEQTGRRVLTLSGLSGLSGYDVAAETPIYVDRNLANGERGETVLHALKTKGFTQLYLFTGDEVSDDERAELASVCSVVGKAIPAEVCGFA